MEGWHGGDGREWGSFGFPLPLRAVTMTTRGGRYETMKDVIVFALLFASTIIGLVAIAVTM